MKVILKEDVKKKGKKGDILNVKDGYGTYLIKNNLAIMETTTSKKILDEENKQKQEQEDKILKEATKLKKELEKVTLTFKLNTSKEGKVFGSISAKQIADALKKQGFDIDRRKVIIDDPINSLGSFYIKIDLHKKVKAKIKINVKQN